MLDLAQTRRQLEATVPDLDVIEKPDVGHMVVGQTAPILVFLTHTQSADRRATNSSR